MNIIKKKIVYGNNDIKNDYFHIVFGIDDDFVRPLGVLMTSILENNKDENIIFHIISKKIKKDNEKIVQEFAINNNIIINIYVIDENIFKKYFITKSVSNIIHCKLMQHLLN